MKLDKGTGKSMSLTQSVYARIAEEFGDEIKLMTALKKGEGTQGIHAVIPSRVAHMVDQMAAKCGRFKTRSDVLRAVIYLGTHIVFHMYQKEIGANAEFFREMARYEESLENFVIYNHAGANIQDILKQSAMGFISSAQAENDIQNIIESAPPHIRQALRTETERLKSGKPFVVVGVKTHGGDRRKDLDTMTP